MTAAHRLMQALAEVEAVLVASGVRPSWAVARAAAVHGVDRLALACALLDKRVACDRARTTVAGIAESDLEPTRIPPKTPRAKTISPKCVESTARGTFFLPEQKDDSKT
jgi:hypothetical protein